MEPLTSAERRTLDMDGQDDTVSLDEGDRESAGLMHARSAEILGDRKNNVW
ncbi:hypothetical protein [Chthonobacter rhizosphaerae]|uniref:hypothetical protein n=1 Tax=Chthonobacter rhizosphaerae TaxID=2735553 RepID=UPI0015EEF4EA|nr:hypothetical protein [Chthonobacter rhizosphaerae]